MVIARRKQFGLAEEGIGTKHLCVRIVIASLGLGATVVAIMGMVVFFGTFGTGI